ncbi:MAG: response regulator transcription factor [Bdellovibrio sp.]|nr:response regulator transcription factor [Bdellovibrio sp.]
MIEDDLVTHKLVKSSLGSDFELISCYSIAEATRVIDSTEGIAAIIIDRGLPEGDGLSVCLKLREDNFGQMVPILFLSSAATETDKVVAFFAGADDYITKPFGLMEFKILTTLVQSIDQVFSRERLLTRVWGLSLNVSDRVVDSYVSHLRKKLQQTGINLESLRGEGYRMSLNATPGIKAQAA